MNLELDEQQSLLKKTCEDFGEKEIRPKIREIESKKDAKELRDKIYELGLFGIEFSEEIGGTEMGMIERALVLETLSEKGDGGTTYSIFYPLFALYALYEFTEEKELLKEGISGTKTIALGKCGLFPNTIRTKAKTDSKEIKIVIEDKNVDSIIFFAEDGKEKFSLCISDDFEIERELFRSGVFSSPAFEVKIKSFKKLTENVTEHKNWQNFLNRIKISVSAICVGICKGATDYALEYALERIAFGRPIAYHQAISFMLADMDTISNSLEITLFRTAYHFDKNSEIKDDISSELVIETLETGRKIVSDAVQILGGHGYIKDHPVEKWMRDFEDIIHAFGSPTSYEGSIKKLSLDI